MLESLLSRYMIKQIAADKVPTVYSEKCINTRQKRQHCEKCVTACPANALENKKGIQLYKDKCTNCNLCVSVCPSVTFVPRMETLEPLYRAVHGQNVVTIGCSKSKADTTIKVECIAQLPWEYFAYVALDNQLQLDLSCCSQCDHQNLKSLIENHLSRLEIFLPEKLYQQHVCLLYGEDGTAGNQLTRREMFSYLYGQGKDQLAKAVPFLFPKNKDARVYRTLLVGKVRQQKKQENRLYGWDYVGVTTKCYGCGVCEQLCPQQAIVIVEEEGIRYFTHNYGKCTHCGICKTVCNQDAIRYSYSKRSGEKIVTAYKLITRNCKDCNDPIPESEDGLCMICRRKRKKSRG